MKKHMELRFDYFLDAWLYYMKNPGYSYPVKTSWKEWSITQTPTN